MNLIGSVRIGFIETRNQSRRYKVVSRHENKGIIHININSKLLHSNLEGAEEN